jgi:lysozyme
MTPISRAALRNDLMRDEGFRQFPYFDCCGKPYRQCACSVKGALTIGVGRNLDANGISKLEAEVLLDHDIYSAEQAAAKSFDWFEALSERRQQVVVNMIFNLGIAKFRGFGNTIAAIKAKDYVKASMQMLASRWAAQVGARATRLAKMMRDGE